MVTEEDIIVEYTPCDEANRSFFRAFNYYGFKGNFTMAQVRKADTNVYRIEENCDELVSEQMKYEERRLLLIEHYCLMEKSRTIKCNLW